VSDPQGDSDPYWFTDEDIEQMARWLSGRVEGLLTDANATLRELRRGSLTLEDVAILAAFQRKAILSNNGYCANKMIAGFVKARKTAHPKQKFYNAHHINEAFAILEAVGVSREVEDAAYSKVRTLSRSRRYKLCCAPNLVSRRYGGISRNGKREECVV
jgi:hypothetical protein